MKKQLIACTLCALLGIGATAFISFNMGKIHGEENVIENQIVYGSGHEFYSSYNGQENVYAYEENSMTVQSVTQLMSEEWQNIVIKDMGYVVFSGNVQDLHDEEILHCHVKEIANCDDDFAITLIIE